MPFRPTNQIPTPSDLRSSLNDTKTATENNALYQTINGLISLADEFKTGITNAFKKTDKLPANQLEGNIPYQSGGTQTGIYLPTFYPINNFTTPEGPTFYTTWWRFGYPNIIQVSGKIAPEITAGAVATEVQTQCEINLPIESYFLHTEQVTGVWNAYPFDGVGASFAGVIWGNPTNRRATLDGMANNGGKSFDIRFILSYEFIPYVS